MEHDSSMKAMNKNKSGKHIVVYYAPDVQRAKHMYSTDILWHENMSKINKNRMWDPVPLMIKSPVDDSRISGKFGAVDFWHSELKG